MAWLKWLMVLGFSLGSVQASAQPEKESSYTHPGSRVGAPAELAGFTRRDVSDSTGSGRDVAVQYRSPDGSSFLTIYLYRSPHPSAALWFEQARQALERNRQLGTPSNGRTATFSTTGSDQRDAFVASYALEGRHRATALAVAAAGNWIVKLRLSSTNLDQAALAERIVAAAQGLTWPQRTAAQAVAIAPCAAPLQDGSEARPADVGDHIRTEAARHLAAVAHGGALRPICFDRQQQMLGIYQEVGETGYLVALGDNGRYARVRPITMPAVRDIYAVEFFDIDGAYLAGFFTGTPTPDQVLSVSDAALRSGRGRVSYLEEEIRPNAQGAVPVT